jgi:succinate dehydrogenase/fumarate reductase flavoprotein subunit
MAEKIVETDVLVVGGGGAACFAAVHAKKKNVKVALVCKGTVGKSGNTLLIGGGLQCDGPGATEIGEAGSPEETKEKLFREIVIEGFYLGNQKLIDVWCRDAAASVKELIDWGYRYNFNPPGSFRQASSGEQSRALAAGVRKNEIERFEDVMLLDILTENGKCVGAMGLDVNTGDLIVFKSKAVVLATSGWGSLWPLNSNCDGNTGDGQAMAFRVGVELAGMEKFTWNPGVILWPPKHRGSIFGYILGFHLDTMMVDNKGQDVLKFYDPKIVEIASNTEFNKNIWSLAEARTVAAGRGSPRGGVYLSCRHIPQNIFDAKVNRLFPTGKWQGEDFTDLLEVLRRGEAVEIVSMAHYAEGGISINEKCETNLPGLYAAGECAAGPFGANRVCDATTEMIVFGGVAGDSAAEYSKTVESVEVDKEQVEALKKKYEAPLERKEGITPMEIRKKIQRIATDYVGIIKNGADLEKALEEIEKLKPVLQEMYMPFKSKRYNLDWVAALEAENMLTCLEATVKSALMRTESRGVFYRLDYPKTDPNWLKEITVNKVDDRMELSTRPLTITTMEPPKLAVTWDDYVVWAVEKLEEPLE